MHRTLFLLNMLVFSLISCFGGSKKKVVTFISKNDSIALVRQLLDSMHLEYLNQNYYVKHPEITATCQYSEPIFLSIHADSGAYFSGDTVQKWPITKAVEHFYKFNFKREGYNNFVRYLKICLPDAKSNIESIKLTIDGMKKGSSFYEEMLNYHLVMLTEWEGNLKLIKTLQTKCISLPNKMSMVYFDYSNKDQNYVRSLDSIFTAYYILRNLRSIEYFHKSYIEVYKESLSDTSKIAKERISALRDLFPINVMDLPFGRKNHLIVDPPLLVPTAEF